jgi:hypothetical protein
LFGTLPIVVPGGDQSDGRALGGQVGDMGGVLKAGETVGGDEGSANFGRERRDAVEVLLAGVVFGGAQVVSGKEGG